MKHILNNISENEKNEILGHYNGKLKIDNSKFNKLVENKLGDVKPLIMEQSSLINQQNKVVETVKNKIEIIFKIFVTLISNVGPFAVPITAYKILTNIDNIKTEFEKNKKQIDQELVKQGIQPDELSVDLILEYWESIKDIIFSYFEGKIDEVKEDISQIFKLTK